MTPPNDAPVTVEQCVAKIMDDRIAYFERTNGYYERADAARSYRATKTALLKALAALASAPAGDGVEAKERACQMLEPLFCGKDHTGKRTVIPYWEAVEVLAAALARPRAAVEPWASHLKIAREAVGALFDDDEQDALADAVRAGRQDHCTPMQAALRALRLLNPTVADSPRGAVAEREAEEVRRIVRWIDQAIERAKKHGNTEGIWLFRSQWQTVRAILALQSPPAKVEAQA